MLEYDPLFVVVTVAHNQALKRIVVCNNFKTVIEAFWGKIVFSKKNHDIHYITVHCHLDIYLYGNTVRNFRKSTELLFMAKIIRWECLCSCLIQFILFLTNHEML